MLDKGLMSLYCTSRCNLCCDECIMGQLRRNDPTYELTLESLQELLDVSAASGYNFFFTLSGGEPSLWRELEAGVKMLRSSEVCQGIEIYTNAVNIDLLTPEVVDNLDSIRISEYSCNMWKLKKLRRLYGDKVLVVDRTGFWPNPTEPVPNTLPAECLYPKSWYYNKQVYACAHSQSLIYTNPLPVRLSVPLAVGFLDELESIREEQAEAVCTICISNNKVRKQVCKIHNKSLYDSRISNL